MVEHIGWSDQVMLVL
jgi:hypothetical protein